jgi:hypothetical protein
MSKLIAVEDVFEHLPDPKMNIYRVGKLTFTSILAPSPQMFIMNTAVVDTDPRYNGFEEVFSFKMLHHVHNIEPTVIKPKYFTHVILPKVNNGGVSFPYIDFYGREKYGFAAK